MISFFASEWGRQKGASPAPLTRKKGDHDDQVTSPERVSLELALTLTPALTLALALSLTLALTLTADPTPAPGTTR